MKVERVEQHYIGLNTHFGKFVDAYCFKSKNLYNYANYIVRESFIEDNNWIRYNKLFEMVKNSDPYKDIGSNVGQATLRMLDKAWKSFFESMKDWSKNPSKYLGRPKLPKYRPKDGRYVLALDNNKVKMKDGFVYFAWKPFKPFNNLFKTNARNRILQCRFVPKGGGYTMEVVYEIDVPDCKNLSDRIVSIDIGVDNFITMVNNIGVNPIAIKGGVIKSINQYYNKTNAKIRSELMKTNKMNWSKKLQQLKDKRYEMIKYHMHCISKYIINWCITHNIDTIVVGHSSNWKQEKSGMQNFTYIPYELFLHMLSYKSQNLGIRYIESEESYTSGTSFLDREEPCKDNYNKERRLYRGLFISNDGHKINADVNAAYQIMKKVFPDVFSDGIEGVGLHPTIINFGNVNGAKVSIN